MAATSDPFSRHASLPHPRSVLGRKGNASTFLEQDALQKRVLVPEHQTLIGSVAVSCLEGGQVGLMSTDGLFQLLDILSPTLVKGSLSLPIPLLPLL